MMKRHSCSHLCFFVAVSAGSGDGPTASTNMSGLVVGCPPIPCVLMPHRQRARRGVRCWWAVSHKILARDTSLRDSHSMCCPHVDDRVDRLELIATLQYSLQPAPKSRRKTQTLIFSSGDEVVRTEAVRRSSVRPADRVRPSGIFSTIFSARRGTFSTIFLDRNPRQRARKGGVRCWWAVSHKIP